MPITISDQEVKHTKSGTAVRFSLSIYVTPGVGQTTKGCMAFRDSKGNIVPKPPLKYLNLYGKTIKYYDIDWSPELVELVAADIERSHGKYLVADPDWNGVRAARRKKQSEDGWAPKDY